MTVQENHIKAPMAKQLQQLQTSWKVEIQFGLQNGSSYQKEGIYIFGRSVSAGNYLPPSGFQPSPIIIDSYNWQLAACSIRFSLTTQPITGH